MADFDWRGIGPSGTRSPARALKRGEPASALDARARIAVAAIALV
jgi:hypothetical protein